jgi:hypothetical protein
MFHDMFSVCYGREDLGRTAVSPTHNAIESLAVSAASGRETQGDARPELSRARPDRRKIRRAGQRHAANLATAMLQALSETAGFAGGVQSHPVGSGRFAIQSDRDLR